MSEKESADRFSRRNLLLASTSLAAASALLARSADSNGASADGVAFGATTEYHLHHG